MLEAAILAVTILVLTFVFGPLLFAPLVVIGVLLWWIYGYNPYKKKGLDK